MTSPAELRQGTQIRTYDRTGSIVFRRTTEEFGGLSNMARGFPLEINGVRIPTSEALYQACRFPHRSEIQRLIVSQVSPMTAKMKSKRYRYDSRPDWHQVRVKIMRWCLRVKLAQNWVSFSRLLLATADHAIIEESRKDDFWGAKPIDERTLVGMNVLGRLLMELREEARSNKGAFLRVEPLLIPSFLFNGRQIHVVIHASAREGNKATQIAVRTTPAAERKAEAAQASLLDQASPTEQADPQKLEEGAPYASTYGLKPYPAYKDSGVPWLGEVPEHWDLERAKWLFRRMERPVRETDEIVTCFRDGIVTLRRNRRVRGFTESLKEIGYQGIRRGDLVIHAMDAFAGAVGVADSDGKGTPVYSVCEPGPSANAHYYAYMIREMARSEWILALAKGIRERSTDFRFDSLASQPVPLPPAPEQSAIVRFLDHADRRVRRYIHAKKRLIALLNEQEQAIIHRAVTCGLDPYARLKPSGVEWLGEVPQHWELRKLRQCGSIMGGMTPSLERSDFWGGDIPWVTPKDMKRAKIDSSIGHVSEAALEGTSLRLIRPPAVLLVVRGMILARHVPVAVTAVPVTINQDMKAIVPGRRIAAKFLALVLRAAQTALAPLIDEAGHGTRRLPTERWRELLVAVPPLAEQAEINAFVDDANAALETAVLQTKREIDLIGEYRTRLIADVVAGKLDVRDAASRLPDEGEQIAPLSDTEELPEDVDEAEGEEPAAVAGEA